MAGHVKIKCYLPFVVSQVKIALAYRMAFFVRILSNFFTVMISWYLWKAIFYSSGSAVINGFTFKEMASYIIVSFFVSVMLASAQADEIPYAIQDGSIAASLIRPLDFCGIQLARSLGSFLADALIFSAPFLLYFTVSGRIMAPSVRNTILFIISILLGYLNLFYFSFCFSMLVFYTTYFFGINMAKSVLIRLCSGALIPLSFFPAYIERIFSLMPFCSMNYTPVMIWLGKLSGAALLGHMLRQVFWAALFYGLAKLCQRAAVRRITILGG